MEMKEDAAARVRADLPKPGACYVRLDCCVDLACVPDPVTVEIALIPLTPMNIEVF